MKVITNLEVIETRKTPEGKALTARDRETGKLSDVTAEEIMIATARGPLTDILHPEKSGVKTTKEGWISVDEVPPDLAVQHLGVRRRTGALPVPAHGQLRIGDRLPERDPQEKSEGGLPRGAPRRVRVIRRLPAWVWGRMKR